MTGPKSVLEGLHVEIIERFERAETQIGYDFRNTVVTRLRRLKELTGYDIQVPREGLILALSLNL